MLLRQILFSSGGESAQPKPKHLLLLITDNLVSYSLVLNLNLMRETLSCCLVRCCIPYLLSWFWNNWMTAVKKTCDCQILGGCLSNKNAHILKLPQPKRPQQGVMLKKNPLRWYGMGRSGFGPIRLYCPCCSLAILATVNRLLKPPISWAVGCSRHPWEKNSHRELTVTTVVTAPGPMITAQSRLGEVPAQSRQGHSSVTARSQLSHG